MFADMSSCPEWQRAKRLIVYFEFVREFASALLFVWMKRAKPILHYFGAVIHAKATLNEFRHAPRCRQERVQVRVEGSVPIAPDERPAGFQYDSIGRCFRRLQRLVHAVQMERSTFEFESDALP